MRRMLWCNDTSTHRYVHKEARMLPYTGWDGKIFVQKMFIIVAGRV